MSAASDHLVALFADTGAAALTAGVWEEAISDLIAQLDERATDEQRRRYVIGAARVAQVEFAGLEERLIEAADRRINDIPRPKTPAPPPPKPKDPPPPPPPPPGPGR